MEIRPLAAKVTANGSGNKTTVGSAQTVYICATADDLITNLTTGFTFQMQLHKYKQSARFQPLFCYLSHWLLLLQLKV
jgi:hypothetical protein